MREKKRRSSSILGEITTANVGDAQRGCEAEHVRWQPWPGATVEVVVSEASDLELLEAIEGGRLEPTTKLGIEVAAEADAVTVVAKGEASSRARVCGKDLGDDGDAVVLLPREAAVNDKVERGGAPEVAPPWREKGCPHGTLDGEEGDDVAKDFVREAADEVKACILPATAIRAR